MADESTDASNIEQLVISIRWVDKEMTVCEEYIGLMPVTQINADTIVVCIICAAAYESQNSRCSWTCSTMTGTTNGVAAQIKKLKERCLLVHCYCHSLNLAVRDTIKNIPLLKDTLDIAYEITKLIRRVLEERRNSTENKQNFWDKWNVISMYTMWTHQLGNRLPNKVDSPSCITECYSEELVNFDEAVGMDTRQHQWLWHEGKNNWSAD